MGHQRPPPRPDGARVPRRPGPVGDTILVNGTFDAYLDVTTELVRFRLLNASNARVYRIGFADDRTFQAVATDGGALHRPADVDRVKLSPGERAEIVVRFAAGETVVMTSVGEPENAANDLEEDEFQLLKLVAGARLAASPAVPAALGGTATVMPPAGARVRRFSLSGSEINDRDMDLTRIDEVVPAGAREIWSASAARRSAASLRSRRARAASPAATVASSTAPTPTVVSAGSSRPCSSRETNGNPAKSSNMPPRTNSRRQSRATV